MDRETAPQRSRLTHDQYYTALLVLVAARSTCARRAVGAIIVDARNRVLSTGYNGVPSGFPHCTTEPCTGVNDPPGDSRRCLAVHAEINAIMQCSRLDLASSLYVSCTPCFTCAKAIANTPIKRVICLEEYADPMGMAVLKVAKIHFIVAAVTNNLIQ